MNRPRPPTDLRRWREATSRRLFIWVLLLLVGLGSVLIALVYGWEAGALGLMCLVIGAGVLVMLWVIFTLLGRWAGAE
ncbi:MAG: hypothetical protein RMM31_11100 [Anaerolineae bacterium]|nr:hypothetical protein [Anaerolineae bacterium]